MERVRINKYLSEMGVCSRREADRLVESGRVMVDGEPAVTGQKVSPEQKILCDGRLVCGGNPDPIWLVVNKPRGIVCTTSDKDRAMNIVEMIGYPHRVYPVGRLDKESEGLLLMTNEGALMDEILRGSHGHEREYQVRVDKPVTERFLKGMAAGVELKELGQTTRPCKVTATGRDSFQIVLTQGLNRQIRRMCQAFGYQVMGLKRIQMMNIRLGYLKPGSYRRMTEEEYAGMCRILRRTR